jgi:hypothetical protein
LGDVVHLATRQAESQWVAEGIDDYVDFRREPAARAADGLIGPPFFRAPALCWWARQNVPASRATEPQHGISRSPHQQRDDCRVRCCGRPCRGGPVVNAQSARIGRLAMHGVPLNPPTGRLSMNHAFADLRIL